MNRDGQSDPVIAVTGAGGFFGRALEPKVAGKGRVRGLFRTESPRSEWWRSRGHEAVHGDLCDEDALATLVRGAQIVYHLAARISKDDPEESWRVNVEGTERLARMARMAGVERLVYVSSISVYAALEPPRGTVREDVLPNNVDLLNPYSATKYAGEEVLRTLTARGDGPDYTIVRPTNVYGPWGRSWFLDWVRRIERMPVVLGGDVEVDLVHVDDVVTALVQSAECDAAAGEVLHIGHESVALAEYVTLLGGIMGRRVRRLPAPLDYLVRVGIDRGHRLLKGSRSSTPLTRTVSFPHDKAREVISYAPMVSLREGLESLARWYRDEYLDRA